MANQIRTILLLGVPSALMTGLGGLSREYLPDATGARIAQDPEELASPLERLDQTARLIPTEVAPATASLFIVNPLAGAEGLSRLFSTHPPMRERVNRLRAMTLKPWRAAA